MHVPGWFLSTPTKVTLYVLSVGAAVTFGSLTHDIVWHHKVAHAGTSAVAPPQAKPGLATSLTLSEGKAKAAALQTDIAKDVELANEVGVTGRIEPYADRTVEIRPRAPGVVRTVYVTFGQTVKAGQPLLTLDSPDIGTARLNLLAKQRELQTIRTESDWRQTVGANVDQLVNALKKSTPSKEIEARFADKPLGSSRQTLLTAYAEFDIATHEEEKQVDLNKQKIVGEHPMLLAIHARESSQAKFEAALEQVKFDAAQQRRVTDQQVRGAEAAVIDAAGRLRILGVVVDRPTLLTSVPPEASHASDDVTIYTIAAPFDGRIITRSVAPSQSVDVADVLMTLSDLSTVLVSADVPESDVAKLPRLEGGEVHLTAAAYPGKTFAAKVLIIGSKVDLATRTVPLIAELSNAEGLLKLGMFVRVSLDADQADRALVVPAASVVEIEGQSVVFCPAKADRTYDLRHVGVGREADGLRVITSGLEAGQVVVSSGAFLLKSELLLQAEGDED
jgi:cobalt-zinc-cadmium efflux system membrane fusion protein